MRLFATSHSRDHSTYSSTRGSSIVVSYYSKISFVHLSLIFLDLISYMILLLCRNRVFFRKFFRREFDNVWAHRWNRWKWKHVFFLRCQPRHYEMRSSFVWNIIAVSESFKQLSNWSSYARGMQIDVNLFHLDQRWKYLQRILLCRREHKVSKWFPYSGCELIDLTLLHSGYVFLVDLVPIYFILWLFFTIAEYATLSWL